MVVKRKGVGGGGVVCTTNSSSSGAICRPWCYCQRQQALLGSVPSLSGCARRMGAEEAAANVCRIVPETCRDWLAPCPGRLVPVVGGNDTDSTVLPSRFLRCPLTGSPMRRRTGSCPGLMRYE